MNLLSKPFLFSVLAAVMVCTTNADEPGKPKGEEKPVELPQEVIAALEKALPGLEIIEIEVKGNGRFYEIEGLADGAEVEVKIKSDGTIEKLEREDGEDSEDDGEDSEGDGEDSDDDGEDSEGDGEDSDEIPADLLGALNDAFDGIVVEKFGLRGGGVNQFYMVEATVNGEKVKLRMSLDGEITQIGGSDDDGGEGEEEDSSEGEEDDSEEEKADENDSEEADNNERGKTTISTEAVPQEVLDTLNELAPGIEIRKVQLETDDGEEIYIIKGKLDGHSVKIEITAAGEVVGKGKGDVDKDPDPLNGCTRGTGYWKNHLEDPAWAVIGADASFFLSGSTNAEMLKTPSKGDAYGIFAHTYLAALLNQENGAIPSAEIQATLDLATVWFDPITPEARPISPSTEDGQTALAFAEMLDSFNRGLLGASNCDGESDAPEEDDEPGEDEEDEEDEEDDEGEGSEGEGDEGEEGTVVPDVSPLDVDLKDLPEAAKAVGLAGSMQLKIATEAGNFYRFECLNRAGRWQPLGGKFRGDGEEKVVRVPVGRATNCTMFRVKITPIPEGEDVPEPPVEGEGDPLP
ncbi:MAG: hypothetical protein ACI9R3_003147 [Verrucomicrobiales bacterium]|jgi:hypothetical protein